MSHTTEALIVVSFLAAALMGCEERERTTPMPDAGAEMDAGPDCNVTPCGPGLMCEMDGGACVPGPCTMVGCPSGQMCDTPTDTCVPETTMCGVDGCPVGLTCDAITGRCIDGPACDVDVIITLSGLCERSTTDCIASLGDIDGCVAADRNPTTCGNCVLNNYISCANTMGCQSDWNGMACCRDRSCDSRFDEACRVGACSGEWATYETCLGAVAVSGCVTQIAECSS